MKAILFNLIYLIPGTFSVMMYINLFYKLFNVNLNLPKKFENIVD
jgi:hypothetical protein